MKVEVKLFASLRDYYPAEYQEDNSTVEISLQQGNTLKNLLEKLNIPEKEVKMVFINNRKQAGDYQLQDGDKVAIFPPIAGG